MSHYSAAAKSRHKSSTTGNRSEPTAELARLAEQIAADREKLTAADQGVAEVNRRYGFVEAVGTRSAILDTEAADVSRALIEKQTLFDRLANQIVPVFTGVGGNGRPKFSMKSVGSVWFKHPDRREYSHITFAPGQRDVGKAYNLWNGWGVPTSRSLSTGAKPSSLLNRRRGLRRIRRKRAKGSCRLFHDHVLNNVCGGNEEHANYVMDWIADIFQNPSKKPGVALALQGAQGVGKTVLGEIIGKLVSDAHYIATSNADVVLGQFNASVESKLLVQMEEACWAGDMGRQNRLKDQITAPTTQIRQLYTAPYTAPLFARFLFTSNEDWFVPVEPGDRRFAVFYVSSDRKEDKGYFRALFAELEAYEAAGYKSLLRHLLTRDIPADRFRTLPRTEARTIQILRTLKSEQEWWFNILQSGELPGRVQEGFVNAHDVYRSYLDHGKNVRFDHASAPNGISEFLKSWVPGLVKTKKKVPNGPNNEVERVPTYVFPPLTECRDAFEMKIGVNNIAWEEPGSDWERDADGNHP